MTVDNVNAKTTTQGLHAIARLARTSVRIKWCFAAVKANALATVVSVTQASWEIIALH